MKHTGKTALLFYIVITGVIWFHIFDGYAFAAEAQAAGWRPVYDLAMRWLNFIILVFVIIKFGKTPLKNFLQAQKEDVEAELHSLENEKQEALQKVKQTEKMLEQSSVRLQELKERLVEQGEKKKQEIVNEANQESRLMMDATKRKIDNYIIKAKSKLRSELVDTAMNIATKKIKTEISHDDNRNFLNHYMNSLNSQKSV
jgi:F-type H+-transporting ATPase subunit b